MTFFNIFRKESEEEQERKSKRTARELDNQKRKVKELNEIVKELNDYIKDKLTKSPLKLQISNAGFPVCPICRDEFKNKEDIIKHLARSKKEFKELESISDGLNIKLSSEEKDDGSKRYFIDKGFMWHSSKRFPLVPADIENLIIEDIAKQNIEDITKHNIDEVKEILEKLIVYAKLYQEIQNRKHREWREGKKKIKNRENSITPKIRFEILKRDNFACHYCGRKAPEVTLEVDHIEPYSKTKNNDSENLITACKECNRGKRVQEVI